MITKWAHLQSPDVQFLELLTGMNQGHVLHTDIKNNAVFRVMMIANKRSY